MIVVYLYHQLCGLVRDGSDEGGVDGGVWVGCHCCHRGPPECCHGSPPVQQHSYNRLRLCPMFLADNLVLQFPIHNLIF